MDDVLIDVRRITDATALPLLVDIDTGWGGAFNIARTIRSMIKASAAPSTSKTRWAKSVAVTGQAKNSCQPPKWSIASRQPPMLEPTSSLS